MVGVSAALQDPEVAQQQRVGPATGAREVFGQRVAEPHVDAALDLTGAEQRVDGPADVVGGDHPLDAAVVVQDHHLGGVAEGHVGDRLVDIGARLRW